MPPSDPFAAVAAEFKKRLSDEEKQNFQMCSLQDLQTEIKRIQERQDAKREMMNLRRIESFLEATEQFGKIIEVFSNTNEFVAFVWGPMKLILQVASSWTYAWDRLLDAYEKLGETFPMLRQYTDLFESCPEMERVLVMLYKDILEFHRKALRFFTRPAWRQVFRALWMDFRASFQHLIDNLDRHRSLVQEQAYALQMRKTRDNFDVVKSALASLQSEQRAAKVQLDREEQKRHSDEQDNVFAWVAGCTAVAKDHHNDAFNSRFKNSGSGSWILHQKTVEDFMNEEIPKNSLVWISGMPGAGKTVLASIIIEHCINDLDMHHTAYFYCKHDDPDTLTTVSILKTVLMQQLCWRSDLMPYFAEQKRSSGEPVLFSDKLVKSLFATACKGPERQYIIIDGIDECSPDQRANLLTFLNSVVTERDTNEPGKIRILVISQNEKDIRRLLGNATEVSLGEAQNLQRHQEDISTYVEQRAHEAYARFAVNEAACQQFSMTTADIENQMRWIAIQAAGQFLYAKLVMENILAQGDQEQFFAEIKSDKLPKGLAEAYERIIIRLRRREQRWHDARLLLGWMTCAARPLKWHEIQGIRSIDYEQEEVNFPLRSFRDDAVEICGSLIVIYGDRVMFMHSTARQFIAESTHIDLALVECGFAAKCLQYLSFECFGPVVEDSSTTFANQWDHEHYVTAGYFAFADYAVSKWMLHLVNVRNAVPALLDPSRWSGSEGREVVVQELEEAAEAFVDEHELDQADGNILTPSPDPENPYLEAVRPLFSDIINNGQNVQILLKHIVRSQATHEGSHRISLPSLEKSFMRSRKTVEDLASDRNTPHETLSELRTFYGNKLYKCGRPHCYFFHEGFADVKSREHHKRRHERPFQCPILGCTSTDFGFSNRADLDKHVVGFHPDAEIKAKLFKIPEKVEKKPSKWRCPECDKSFARRGILNDHLAAHRGQKQHECRVCGKAFTRQNDRVRHEKIHENRVKR